MILQIAIIAFFLGNAMRIIADTIRQNKLRYNA